jgi:hypothetical protein
MKHKVVGQFGEVRQQVGNHLAGLAARLEFPVRLGQVPVLTLERDQFVHAWHRLAMPPDKFRFVVPALQVRARARAENDQHVLRFRREVRRTRRVGMLRRPLRPDGRFARS